MKFAIDIGHNAPVDSGAVGIKREDRLTKSVGEKLIKLLSENGHKIVETRPKFATTIIESLRYRVSMANQSNADVFVSIHFNAANFRAHGTEIYALSKAGGAIAKSVLSEIVSLGFHNRGVKKANFYVLRHTSMPAILVECCFCDSEKDMAIFDANAMAEAIAEGLIGELPKTDNGLRCLKIYKSTWLKITTEQSTNLSVKNKVWMKANKYQVLAALPEEEGHYWVRLLNGTEGFIFAGHANLS